MGNPVRTAGLKAEPVVKLHLPVRTGCLLLVAFIPELEPPFFTISVTPDKTTRVF